MECNTGLDTEVVLERALNKKKTPTLVKGIVFHAEDEEWLFLPKVWGNNSTKAVYKITKKPIGEFKMFARKLIMV
jgi:hypothetical protein